MKFGARGSPAELVRWTVRSRCFRGVSFNCCNIDQKSSCLRTVRYSHAITRASM